MKYMTINNRQVAFDDEKNVLQVIRKSGINLPTFCYHSELSTYGACRMCVVEDNRGKIFASCSETPRDGMVIYTNTPRLQHHRKMILELLLASQPVVSLTSGDGETDDKQFDIPVDSEEEKINERLSLDKCIEELSEKDRKLIELRYFMSETQTEVAGKLGMSQVQVSRREKKILKEKREKMTV